MKAEANAGSGWVTEALRACAGAAALCAFGSSVVFDAIGHRSEGQFVYARGSYLLTCIGLLVGVAGVVFQVSHVSVLPSGTASRRRGFVQLAVADLVLLWFAFCYLLRRPHSYTTLTFVVSLISGVVVAVGTVSHVLGLRPDADPAPRDG